MTTNEIFKEVLKDPILINKYGFSKDQLEKLGMFENSKTIIEIIKIIIQGNENRIPDQSIYKQIKKIQNIK